MWPLRGGRVWLAPMDSASVTADSEMEIGTLSRSDLDALVRRRPDIGAVVYRNMAEGLGDKLRRADAGG